MILEAVNVHKSYSGLDNTVHVLKGIDIEIEEGEVISIVGPSGAGKSTLLHVLGGLDKPDQGTVNLDGENVYNLNDAAKAKMRNSKVGFVFQFYHLLPEFTALENVLLPGMIQAQRGKSKQLEMAGLDLLERVGLKQRVSHRRVIRSAFLTFLSEPSSPARVSCNRRHSAMSSIDSAKRQ